MTRTDAPGALDGLVVLDLTGARGNYCGKLLAELGADVILIEPPEGSELRHHPPFLDDEPGPERSLRFAYLNTSKRSVVLDLEVEGGRDALRRLAERADVIVESFMPGRMAELGLAYDELRAINPRLVMASITPFGQTGPYADFEAPDLVCLALSGFLSLAGYPDSAPMRAPDEQGHLAAGLFAATAVLLAVLHAEQTGEGQHVDVSVHEALTMALENAVQTYDLEGQVRRRAGGVHRHAGNGLYQAADGYVFLMASGIGGNRFWPNLVAWLTEERVPGAERLAGPEWSEPAYLGRDDAKRVFGEVFEPYARALTRDRLVEFGQRHRVPIASVLAPREVLDRPQLAHRGFPQPIEVAPGRVHPAPGAPYLLSATPWRSTGRAPRLGEHTREVLGALAAASAEGGAA